MKATDVAKLLGVNEKYIKKCKGGWFRYHVSYFYGFTKSADGLIDLVKSRVPNAQILDSGNHYHEFVGGAKSGSAKDSYLWVKFNL